MWSEAPEECWKPGAREDDGERGERSFAMWHRGGTRHDRRDMVKLEALKGEYEARKRRGGDEDGVGGGQVAPERSRWHRQKEWGGM